MSDTHESFVTYSNAKVTVHRENVALMTFTVTAERGEDVPSDVEVIKNLRVGEPAYISKNAHGEEIDMRGARRLWFSQNSGLESTVSVDPVIAEDGSLEKVQVFWIFPEFPYDTPIDFSVQIVHPSFILQK